MRIIFAAMSSLQELIQQHEQEISAFKPANAADLEAYRIKFLGTKGIVKQIFGFAILHGEKVANPADEISLKRIVNETATTVLKAESAQQVNARIMGKMSEVLEDYSPFQIGTAGQYAGKSFSLIGRILCNRKQFRQWIAERQQRPVSIFSIFIGIAKQKFAKAHYVSILNLVLARNSLALPIEGGLTYSVGKSEWLMAIQVNGCEAADVLESPLPISGLH